MLPEKAGGTVEELYAAKVASAREKPPAPPDAESNHASRRQSRQRTRFGTAAAADCAARESATKRAAAVRIADEEVRAAFDRGGVGRDEHAAVDSRPAHVGVRAAEHERAAADLYEADAAAAVADRAGESCGRRVAHGELLPTTNYS